MIAQSLHRHLETVKELVLGLPLYGNDFAIDVLYDKADKQERAALVARDKAALETAGYSTKVVGRNRYLAVSLTDVRNAFNARFVQ